MKNSKLKRKTKDGKEKVWKKQDRKKSNIGTGNTEAQKKPRIKKDSKSPVNKSQCSQKNSASSVLQKKQTKVKKASKTTKTPKTKKSPEPQTLAKPRTRRCRTKPSRAEAQTMEELLAQTGYQLRGLRTGQEVEGTVTAIGKKKMLIDIGAKTEGVILGKEYEAVKEFVSTLSVGSKVKAVVGMAENDRGQILLALRKAAEDYKWQLFEKYLKTGERLEVRGLDVNRGGMIARAADVYGFVPVSQFGRQWLGNLEKLYNKVFEVKIIEVDRSKNRLIFSEKAVSEAQTLAAQKEALKKVKVGDALEGVISGIMPFGIFVRVEISEGTPAPDPPVGGSVRGTAEKNRRHRDSVPSKNPVPSGTKDLFLEGLVHISEISWEKVENLNKLYKIGQKVKVKVLGIDKESSRLNLSIKQLKTDPWADLAKKYPSDKKIEGKVTKLVAFGAFVSLGPGVEGLIHISKIPADFDIKVDKKVNVYIENIDSDHRRIALGLVLAKKPVGYK